MNISHINTVVRLVNVGDNQAVPGHESSQKTRQLSCSGTKNAILYYPSGSFKNDGNDNNNTNSNKNDSDPPKAKFIFDACYDLNINIPSFINYTNLRTLIEQTFLGYNVGIFSLGVGSLELKSDKLDFMKEVYRTFKSSFMNFSKDFSIQFAFAFLGLQDEYLVDIATNSIISKEDIISNHITMDDLLIQADFLDEVEPFLDKGSMFQSLVFFKLIIENKIDNSNPILSSTFCLADLGFYDSCDLKSKDSSGISDSLRAMKNIGLLLHQPYASAVVPYNLNHITRLLQDFIGGNAQTCLILQVDPFDITEKTFAAFHFCEVMRSVSNRPILNMEDPKFKELEELNYIKDSLKTLRKSSMKRCSALEDYINRLRKSNQSFQETINLMKYHLNEKQSFMEYQKNCAVTNKEDQLDTIRKIRIEKVISAGQHIITDKKNREIMYLNGYLKQFIENIRSFSSNLQDNFGKEMISYEAIINDLESQLKKYKSSCSELQDQLNTISDKLKEKEFILDTEKSNFKEKYSSLEITSSEALSRIQKELQDITSVKTNLEINLTEKISHLNSMEKEKTLLYNERLKQEKDYEKALNKIRELEAEIKNYKETQSSLKLELSSFKDLCETLRSLNLQKIHHTEFDNNSNIVNEKKFALDYRDYSEDLKKIELQTKSMMEDRQLLGEEIIQLKKRLSLLTKDHLNEDHAIKSAYQNNNNHIEKYQRQFENLVPISSVTEKKNDNFIDTTNKSSPAPKNLEKKSKKNVKIKHSVNLPNLKKSLPRRSKKDVMYRPNEDSESQTESESDSQSQSSQRPPSQLDSSNYSEVDESAPEDVNLKTEVINNHNDMDNSNLSLSFSKANKDMLEGEKDIKISRFSPAKKKTTAPKKIREKISSNKQNPSGGGRAKADSVSCMNSDANLTLHLISTSDKPDKFNSSKNGSFPSYGNAPTTQAKGSKTSQNALPNLLTTAIFNPSADRPIMGLEETSVSDENTSFLSNLSLQSFVGNSCKGDMTSFLSEERNVSERQNKKIKLNKPTLLSSNALSSIQSVSSRIRLGNPTLSSIMAGFNTTVPKL